MIELRIASVLAGSAPLAALVADRIDWGQRQEGSAVPMLFFRCPESEPEVATASFFGGWFTTYAELWGVAETIQEARAVSYAAALALFAASQTVAEGVSLGAMVPSSIMTEVDSAFNGESRGLVGFAYRVKLRYRIAP
jgi:hypothetical protein